MALINTAKEFMWIQKWRAATMDDIALPQAMRNEMNYYIEHKECNHLMLYSPSPGTGKTSAAVVLAMAMGCKKPFVVNASKDTDIHTVRNNVYQYATGASLVNRGMKVVVLDEVDRLSAQAQDALKGIMEEVSHVCAFIITTNHKYSINEKLRSRCAEMKFYYTDDDMTKCMAQMAKRCCYILDQEGVKYDRRVVMSVIKKMSPDFRSCIMKLQQMYIRYGEINAAALQELDSLDLTDLVKILVDGSYGDMLKWVTDNHGNLSSSFYRDLYEALRPMIKDNGQLTAQVIMELGEEQKHHNQVPDLFLHITRVLTLITGLIK